MTAEYINDLLMLATQPSNSLEDRQVSFTGPVLFQTLTASYPNVLIGLDRSREGVNQSSFANACFSSNKDDLTFTRKHLFKRASHPRQHVLASDELLREFNRKRCI